MADILRRALFRYPQMVFTQAVSVRTLLTTSYGNQEKLKCFLESRKTKIYGQALSSICLLIDRCAEKGMPFSSLTTDDMVHAIEDRDDIVSSMYYLHKFRHSDSCYFLRPWTVHTWFGKCLDNDAMDLALMALDEKFQYGTFPDEMMYILLIDKCIKKKDFSLAFKFVTHAFLGECLDSELAQLVCLHVILETMRKGNTITPDFPTLAEHRNFFSVCYRLGQMLGDDNIQLLGLAELGAIEQEHGIRAIYQEPWCPLLWQEGYFDRASSLLHESTGLHQEVVDHVNNLIINRQQEEHVPVSKPVSPDNEQSFVNTMLRKYGIRISNAETSAIEKFNATVDIWAQKHAQLSQVETKIATEKLKQRQDYFEEKRLAKLSKRLAVERLGYWQFMTEEVVDDDGLDYHLRTDYIEGASSDIEIEKRISDSAGI